MNEMIKPVVPTNCEQVPTDKELVGFGLAHKKMD